MLVQKPNNLELALKHVLNPHCHVVPLTNNEAVKLWNDGVPVYMTESRFKDRKSYRWGEKQYANLKQVPAQESVGTTFDVAMQALIPGFQLLYHRYTHDAISYVAIIDDRTCATSGADLQLFSGNIYTTHNTEKHWGAVYCLSPADGRYHYIGFLNKGDARTRRSMRICIERMLEHYHGAHL